jgi:hypothetical protein
MIDRAHCMAPGWRAAVGQGSVSEASNWWVHHQGEVSHADYATNPGPILGGSFESRIDVALCSSMHPLAPIFGNSITSYRLPCRLCATKQQQCWQHSP